MPRTSEQIRHDVTALLLESMMEGKIPWRRPWANSTNTGSPCNFQSGRRYTGINPIILMINSMVRGLSSQNWGSVPAWMKTVGAQVKKDEKATWIVFYNMFPKKDSTGKVLKNNDGKDVMIPFLKEYPIFNAEQMQAPTVNTLLDGRCGAGRQSVVKNLLHSKSPKPRLNATTLPELQAIASMYVPKYKPSEHQTREDLAEKIQDAIKAKLQKYLPGKVVKNKDPNFGPAEDFIAATKAVINYGGERAFYSPSTDEIGSPIKSAFDSITDYYETILHELIHRQVAHNKWKFEYAFEELVAEIGSCLLLVELNVPMADKMLAPSAAYLSAWLALMGNNVKFIFDAASIAGKCVTQLLSQTQMNVLPEEISEGISETPHEVGHSSSC